MIQKNLNDIAKMVSGKVWLPDSQTIIINGVSIDSKTTQQGNLFIPIIRNDDGHKYILHAIGNGAVASLWQSNHPNPPPKIPLIIVEDTFIALQALAKAYRTELNAIIIGITGSNGKTTTKDMMSSILSTTFKVHKTKGNLNGQYGLPLTLLETSQDAEVVVLEMGISYPGEMERLAGIAGPDVVVLTMIGESHISNFGSRENIAQAKLQITNGLPENSVLVFNGDEELLEEGVKKLHFHESVKFIRFGTANQNDYFADSISVLSDRTTFVLNDHPYSFPLLGAHHVNNALASIAVAQHLGVTSDNITKGLKELEITGMRMEKSKAKSGFTIINDAWNASPTSMRSAIETFQKLSEYNQKIVVLGDMLELGENETRFHQEIGRLLDPRCVDYVFTVGKLAEFIALEASGVFPKGHVTAFRQKEEIAKAIELIIQPNSIVLVKGSRGLKLEEVVEQLLML
ncbi:UDP-N-acetylmuramoyl-tripeptide--D-alanyl-D-alanine ligase [Paenibacillus pinihumi]|uniref:UDP-N-acetylmuramoyl-tripeptide--D-alanyl-D- alanine ligase n=1 Tax=Paenibacillus pinihumi TaxID=669462 RepID=UPI00056919DD|nr:UDP-N-acetylmuramoyl-tripeptide--D-alanyl-D-alanine ligase [Paenibacillus pinihumi]